MASALTPSQEWGNQAQQSLDLREVRAGNPTLFYMPGTETQRKPSIGLLSPDTLVAVGVGGGFLTGIQSPHMDSMAGSLGRFLLSRRHKRHPHSPMVVAPPRCREPQPSLFGPGCSELQRWFRPGPTPCALPSVSRVILNRSVRVETHHRGHCQFRKTQETG